MSIDKEYQYKVFVTKSCRRQGSKLPISLMERLEIITSLKSLRLWPIVAMDFEYETAFGAYEFKFNTKDHWVRVFVHFEDERKIAWVFKVIVKKANDLRAFEISIRTALSELRRDLDNWKKEQKNIELKNRLSVVKGGLNE